MENIPAHLGLFLAAVVNHLFTLLAGCVVTVVIGIIEKRVLKRPISLRLEVSVLLFFLFFACFQAWNDEHKNSQVLISEKAIESGLKNSCQADLRVEGVASRFLQLQLNSQNGTLGKTQGQLADQQQNLNKAQALTNDCLVIVGKKAIAPPLSLTLSLKPIKEDGYRMSVSKEVAIFIQTNVRFPNPRVLVECNKPFDVINPGVITAEGPTLRAPEANPRENRNSFLINIVSPDLLPTSQLFTVIQYEPNYEGEVIGCRVQKAS